MFQCNFLSITSKASFFFFAFLVIFGAILGNDCATRILGGYYEFSDEIEGDVFHTKTSPRPFLLELEKTITSCTTEGSFCEAYRSLYIHGVKMGTCSCDDFALAAYFHTTTSHGSCGNHDNLVSLKENSIESSFRTKNITTFVNELSFPLMQNNMCYIKMGQEKCKHSGHAIALETRQNGFYIYNSWYNLFSNAWFSGLTTGNLSEFSKSDSIWNRQEQELFIDYKTQCGLGNRLNESELENCFKKLVTIFHVIEPSSTMNFKYMCKNLVQKFEILK